MKNLSIQSTFVLFVIQLVFIQTALAGSYINTSEERLRLKQFIENRTGTLICEAVRGYIYGKGITVYLKTSHGRFFLSAYNNNTEEWMVRDSEMDLNTDLSNESIAYFESVNDNNSNLYNLDIGVGDYRDIVSWIGDRRASIDFPYTGSFAYQFHNVCMIK